MKTLISPKIKFFLLFFFTTLFLFINNFFLLFFFSLILTASFYYLKKEKNFQSRLHFFLLMGIFVISFQVLFNHLLPLEERILKGLTAASKIFLLSSLVFLYTETTSFQEIRENLSFLPKKFRLAATLLFLFLPLIFVEGKKILLVQSTRGLNSKSVNPQKSLFPLVIPLLHRIFTRAEQITLVILSRGYEEN